jgi:hypothetical protein
MPYRARAQAWMLSAAYALSTLAAAGALASDPLPGDTVAPLPNSNLIMLYDEYQNDDRYGGQPGNAHGPDSTKDTHLAGNFFVLRYVHGFSLAGHDAGVQVYLPYVAYFGGQSAGINDLGSAAPGLLPSIGRGHVNLSNTSGFAQPNFGAFFYPLANRETGTYLMLGPWVVPPIGSFDKASNLNASPNLWTFEAEFSFRTLLFGTPQTRNLAFVIWEENYLYLSNPNAAAAGDTIFADTIPPIYRSLGAANPVITTAARDAVFREQPTTELRLYLPYTILPSARFYISPGLFQSFGGKQTYKISGAGILDSGARTAETQLRLVASSFVSPTMQILLAADYDVAAHGGPYQRSVEIRVLKAF